MPTLQYHAAQLKTELPDAQIKRDFVTDNLLVTDGERGFAVTHLCLDTWPHERVAREAKDAFKSMRAGKLESADGVKFFTLAELEQQRHTALSF